MKIVSFVLDVAIEFQEICEHKVTSCVIDNDWYVIIQHKDDLEVNLSSKSKLQNTTVVIEANSFVCSVVDERSKNMFKDLLRSIEHVASRANKNAVYVHHIPKDSFLRTLLPQRGFFVEKQGNHYKAYKLIYSQNMFN